MAFLKNIRFACMLTAGVAASACGYDAVPAQFTVDLSIVGGAQQRISPRGVADVDATQEGERLLFWARWRAEEEGVELIISIDTSRLPESIRSDERPVTLGPPDARVRLRFRDQDGELIREVESNASAVEIRAFRSYQAGRVSSGVFRIELPDDDTYTEVSGTWVTEPSPSSGLVDVRPPGDGFRFGDADTGTSEIPDPGVACSCVDDPEPLPSPTPDPDPDIDTGGDGCGCEGDTFEDTDTDVDASGGDGVSSCDGCESCEGEDVSGSTVASAASHREWGAGSRCYRPVGRVLLQASPLAGLFLLSLWRRRRF